MIVRSTNALTFLLATVWHAGSIASSGSGHHDINWWHLGPAYKDAPAIGWLTLTFLIFLWLVARAVKKPLALYLETRSKDIQRQIEESRVMKLESEKNLQAMDERLRCLDQEITQLNKQFIEQAEAEKKEIARVLAQMKSRTQKETMDNIEAEAARSKNRLAKEVLTIAMLKAKEKLYKSDLKSLNTNLTRDLLLDLGQFADHSAKKKFKLGHGDKPVFSEGSECFSNQ